MFIYFELQSKAMMDKNSSAGQLQQIKTMMERSSRFISLSGLSGVGAGLCALGGAWMAASKLNCSVVESCSVQEILEGGGVSLMYDLLWIAAITFAAAFVTAFIFTWVRSKKQQVSMMGSTTARLFWNTAIPIAAGAVFLIRIIQQGQYELIAPGCLIFYGLALVNASKYTLGEIRYLGMSLILLGIINLWLPGYGLLFWVVGFGLMHIIYGAAMWWKYERNNNESR